MYIYTTNIQYMKDIKTEGHTKKMIKVKDTVAAATWLYLYWPTDMYKFEGNTIHIYYFTPENGERLKKHFETILK